MIEENKEQEEINEEILPSYLLAAPMKNDIGEQNSFINVIIHFLHYIPEISKYIIETEISDEEQYNMLTEIQRLLDKYEKLTSIIYCPKISKNLRNLNILQLRRELEYLFSNEKLFKTQTTGDPVDVYYFVLNAIHLYCNNRYNLKENDDLECNSECVIHSNLMLFLVEQLECPRCKKKSELRKFPNNTFYYELKVDFVIKKTDRMQYWNNFKGKLFQFCKEESEETEEECNQNECRDSHPIMNRKVILVKSNKYISFTLTWPDLNPKLIDMCKVYFSIPEIFANEELFNIYDDEYKRKFELFGLICYNNGQYICFFLSQNKSEVVKYWILHKDMEVIKLNLWKDVITYCIMNSYYPVMFYYKELPDKPDLTIRCDLVEGDYFQMFNHSLKVDLENAITYANEAQVNNKVRPNDYLRKSEDDNLLLQVNKMKTESIPKRIKRASEYRELVNEGMTQSDGTKKYSSQGDNEETIPSKIIEDIHQEQYQEIDLKTLQSEEFRLNPYQREGDWFCKSDNCNNLNNKLTFQCLKCKAINMSKFQEIEKEKENKYKMNKDITITNISMLDKQKVHLIKTNYGLNQEMQKICLNCNTPFKIKCNCSTSLSQSFKHIQDNSTQLNECYKIKLNSHSDFLTISKSEHSGWICFHCSSYNVIGFDYCKHCKKNKQIR